MKSAIAYLVGKSPYSQSKHYSKEDVPPLPKELPELRSAISDLRVHVLQGRDPWVELQFDAWIRRLTNAAEDLRALRRQKGRSAGRLPGIAPKAEQGEVAARADRGAGLAGKDRKEEQ